MPVAATPSARSPCTPRTYATPSRAARYGDSPYVSSVRPQRGSRAMSSTGASVCRAPVRDHLLADHRADAFEQVRDPTCSRGRSPAGTASRHARTGPRCSPRARSPGYRAACARRDSAGSRSLNAARSRGRSPVDAPMRVISPMPCASSRVGGSALRRRRRRRVAVRPHAPELRELLVERHPGQEIVDHRPILVGSAAGVRPLRFNH